MTATAPRQILELDTLACTGDGRGDRASPVAGRDGLWFRGTVDRRVRQRVAEPEQVLDVIHEWSIIASAAPAPPC